MTSHVAWRGLPPRSRRAWSRWRWRVCSLSSKERARLKPSCEPFGNYLIQALGLSMISMLRLPPHGCQCAIRAPSTGSQRRDLPSGYKRGQRFDEGRPTNRELDGRARPRGSRGYLYDHSRRNTFRDCEAAARQTAHGVGRGWPPVLGCLSLRTGPGASGGPLRGRQVGSPTARPHPGRKRPVGGRDGSRPRCDAGQPR
jgi:hypothetical protein